MSNVEGAIIGLKGLKPMLGGLLKKINYENLGEEDKKELEEHFDLAIQALEKQVPKAVVCKSAREDSVQEVHCPNCKGSFGNADYIEEFGLDNYCSICGQALKWEDDDNA